MLFKCTFLIAAVAISVTCSAQLNDVPDRQVMQNFSLEKSIKQKRTGNIFLITGAGLILTGAIFPKGDLEESNGICPGGGILCNEKYENDGIKTAFIVAGAVSALTSVPFYISAKRNRRRAALGQIDIENLILPQNRGYVMRSIPRLCLRVEL